MREVIQEAKTIEEAIDLACQQLGVERGDAEFEILTLPKRGFLGLRNTPAKVRVYVEEPAPAPEHPRREERPRPPRPERGERPERPEHRQERSERGERPERPRREERPRPPRPERGERPAPQPKEQPKESQGEGALPAAPAQRPARPPRPEQQALLEFVPASQLEGKARVAADYLQEVLSSMDIHAEITGAFPENGVILRLSGEGLGVIIGRRGETLDALQYLCGLVANRQEGDYLRVTIDSGNYRQKRERTLEQLAKKLSGTVARTGRPATLEPMNPYERRIIHATVSKLEGVTSASIGEEPNRRVVISSTNPRPQPPRGGRPGGRGGRPGSRDNGRRDGRGPRGGGRDRDRREGGYREGGYREPRESQPVTPLSVDQELAREIDQGYVAPEPAEKQEVVREVVPPTRAQASKEGEDLPLYGKIEL